MSFSYAAGMTFLLFVGSLMFLAASAALIIADTWWLPYLFIQQIPEVTGKRSLKARD